MSPLGYIIGCSVILYLLITFLLNRAFSVGEVTWWQRVAVALWPVTGPLLLVAIVLHAVFLGD